jgi:hypothetical protein
MNSSLAALDDRQPTCSGRTGQRAVAIRRERSEIAFKIELSGRSTGSQLAGLRLARVAGSFRAEPQEDHQ